MFRLVHADVKPLTKELAEQFRNLEASPTERELNQSRIKMLREKAEAGTLVTFHWSTAKLGSKKLRMNGQHSSNMLCGLNGQFPDGLKVHLDEYEVDSKEALAVLFRQFDDRKSGRTSSDVSGAYQGLFEPLHDVPRKAAKLGVEAINWYRHQVAGTGGKSGDDVYSLFGETGLHAFLRWLGELFSIKTPELTRATVVSAMYATFIANETEARTFWQEVARGGVEYEDNAPATVLDTWLKNLKEDPKGKDNLKPGNYYQGCIFAWNALRDNKTIATIKFDTKKGLHTVSE